MSIEDVLWHPLVALSAFGSLLLSVVPGLAPLWDLLGATSGTWFSLLAVSTGTILPEFGYGDEAQLVLLAGAILYVALYTDRLIDRIQQFRNDA